MNNEVLQHLNNLYLAARSANLKAHEHEQIQRSAIELEKWVKEALEKQEKVNSKAN